MIWLWLKKYYCIKNGKYNNIYIFYYLLNFMVNHHLLFIISLHLFTTKLFSRLFSCVKYCILDSIFLRIPGNYSASESLFLRY
jgi:hypothetical protein